MFAPASFNDEVGAACMCVAPDRGVVRRVLRVLCY